MKKIIKEKSTQKRIYRNGKINHCLGFTPKEYDFIISKDPTGEKKLGNGIRVIMRKAGFKPTRV